MILLLSILLLLCCVALVWQELVILAQRRINVRLRGEISDRDRRAAYPLRHMIYQRMVDELDSQED